jgi:hypothetical protein
MTANEPPSGDEWVDPDDAPEWTDEDFARADQYDNGRLVKPGLAANGEPKVKLDDVFVSPDVAEALKGIPCWQTMIDDLLRKWAEGGVRFVRPGQDDEKSATSEAAE